MTQTLPQALMYRGSNRAREAQLPTQVALAAQNSTAHDASQATRCGLFQDVAAFSGGTRVRQVRPRSAWSVAVFSRCAVSATPMHELATTSGASTAIAGWPASPFGLRALKAQGSCVHGYRESPEFNFIDGVPFAEIFVKGFGLADPLLYCRGYCDAMPDGCAGFFYQNRSHTYTQAP